MKSRLRNIESGKGLGPILFGLQRDEVEKALGSPNEIDEYVYDDEGDDRMEIWHYDQDELSLSFNEEDDWRLTIVAITSPYYELEGKKLIGKGLNEAKEILTKLGVNDLEEEDYSDIDDPNHFLLRSDSLGMNFWFDDDLLNEIQWSPLLDEEGCIVWPN